MAVYLVVKKYLNLVSSLDFFIHNYTHIVLFNKFLNVFMIKIFNYIDI